MKKKTATRSVRVTEEKTDGIFPHRTFRHVPSDDTPGAHAAALRAWAEEINSRKPWDWITSPAARAKAIAFAEDIFTVANGGVTLKAEPAAIRSELKAGRKGGSAKRGKVNRAAKDEALFARSYLTKIADDPAAVETAFRAGWHLARALALVHPVAGYAGKMAKAGKGPKPARKEKVAPLRNAVLNAFENFRALKPEGTKEHFLCWLSEEANGETNGSDFDLRAFFGEGGTHKIEFTTENQQKLTRSWRTVRRWL